MRRPFSTEGRATRFRETTPDHMRTAFHGLSGEREPYG